MAVYPPPSFQSNIFDTNAFNQSNGNAGLTEAEANLLYYKYPVGQATQTLQQTDHTGLASFQAGIDINVGTLKFPDNTVQTTAATAGTNLLPLNNVWTGTNEFQSTAQFDSALIVYNGNQNTSLGNGFLPLAVGQGTQNVFIGVGAGGSALCGSGNTVCGFFSASEGMTSASSFNTLYGERAGQYLTSGAGNTLIGATNCNNVTTGNSNICLGYGAMAGESSGSFSNNIVIGNGVQSGSSDRIIIGDTSQTSMDLQVIPTAFGGGVIRMNNNLSMNNIITAGNRQISSSYYNFYDVNTITSLLYTGRLYGAQNQIIYDCPDTNSSGSSNHVFYCYNGGTPLNSLTISNTGITNNTPQPASNNTSNIVPTTAWVQSAITAGAGTNLIPANNTWTGTNAFNNVAPITSTATQPASTDNTTKIPTTAWVQGAISGGGIQNPTTWLVATGNIQNNAHLNNASKQCNMNIQTSIPFFISQALTARFKFEYSVYGVSAYNSGNMCSTAGTINLCANNTVNNPNTVTYFDMIYGYNGGSSTQAVFRIANVQTTSTYWNTQQTYVPKNATSTSWNFTPLSFTFTFSGTNPNHIQFNIGFPQNPSITGVGDMLCCSASLSIITSPPSGALTGYLLDSIVSTNTAGSWYFA